LLELKQAQLAGVRKEDSDLARQIAEVSARIQSYEAQSKKPEAPAGILQLGKKRADGSIERIRGRSSEVSAAE